MEKLFDNDFFKFLAGFLFLLLVSGVLIFAARLYDKSNVAGVSVPCEKSGGC